VQVSDYFPLVFPQLLLRKSTVLFGYEIPQTEHAICAIMPDRSDEKIGNISEITSFNNLMKARLNPIRHRPIEVIKQHIEYQKKYHRKFFRERLDCFNDPRIYTLLYQSFGRRILRDYWNIYFPGWDHGDSGSWFVSSDESGNGKVI
jgi:hypothetical protein